MQYWLEASHLRDTCWLQASDGSTVGRFGRFGIDLHHTITEQMAGLPECRLCTHGRPSAADWQLFREKALEWWGIEVPIDTFDSKYLSDSVQTGS